MQIRGKTGFFETRPDTRLPQSRVGGQEPFLRSLHHLGRSKDRKNPKRTNGLTKQGVESLSKQLETEDDQNLNKAG